MKNKILIIHGFIIINLSVFGQKFHCYEVAKADYNMYEGDMLIPLRSDLKDSQIEKVDMQITFYNDNTLDIINKGKKIELNYKSIDGGYLVNISEVLCSLMLNKNPLIPNEYMIYQYKYFSQKDAEKGGSVVIYYCQLLK